MTVLFISEEDCRLAVLVTVSAERGCSMTTFWIASIAALPSSMISEKASVAICLATSATFSVSVVMAASS